MMKKKVIVLVFGFGFLWASTVSAKECGLRRSVFVSPFGCGCFCPVFFSVGTRLGLGPGYPGLRPPISFFNHCGLYPSRYHLPLRTPSVMGYTIRPFTRVRAAQRDAPSVLIARDNSLDQRSPAQAVIGRDFRRPAPALEEEANNSPQFDDYIPRLCYRGECYAISPKKALSSDVQPGVIIWEPKN